MEQVGGLFPLRVLPVRGPADHQPGYTHHLSQGREVIVAAANQFENLETAVGEMLLNADGVNR